MDIQEILWSSLRNLQATPPNPTPPGEHPLPGLSQAKLLLRRQLGQQWLAAHAAPRDRQDLARTVESDPRWQHILSAAAAYLPALEVMPPGQFRWVGIHEARPALGQPVLYFLDWSGLHAGHYLGSTGTLNIAGHRVALPGDITFASIFGDTVRDMVTHWQPLPGFPPSRPGQ